MEPCEDSCHTAGTRAQIMLNRTGGVAWVTSEVCTCFAAGQDSISSISRGEQARRNYRGEQNLANAAKLT